jgi:carbonic anhydrase
LEQEICVRLVRRLLLSVCVSILVACGQETHQEAANGSASPTGDSPEAEEHEVHWGYEGEIGPEYWAELSPEFALCAKGVEQSPIDLTEATVVEGEAPARRYGEPVISVEQRASVMNLINNGHTIQVSSDAPVSLNLDGELYQLVQYHLHAPSEHTIDGSHSPLELHAVHKSAEGDLAVAAVLMGEGEHNPLVDPIIALLPSGPGDERQIEDLELNPDDIQPVPGHYFRYRGSLTTPPCSEAVEWIVSADERHISPEQMAAITSQLHDNNRPVQALGRRELLEVVR